MPKLLLTDTFITNGLTCPIDKRRVEYCDTRLPGLYIEVRSTSPGQGTYYLRYKDATGKTCHQKLARTDEIDLPEARSRAKTLKAEIQLGRDPRAEAHQRKQSMTWTELFERRYLPHVKPHKRSWGNDEDMHRLRLIQRFGHLRLNQITRHSVQQFHNELRESALSPATADHHLKLIRQALNLAFDWGLLDANPVARVKLFNVDNR
jgi:hypothetical protein